MHIVFEVRFIIAKRICSASKFFDVNVATEQDVYAICQANGLTDPAEIKRVQREAAQGEYDLRRVKRVVHACKRIQEAQRMKGEQA